MPYSVKKFGWLPDLPDARDFTYSAPHAMLRKLPARVDLTGKCPPVYDQGDLGSCTGNSIAAAIEFAERKEALARATTPSRLFIYYNERVIEHTVATDAGAMIRDGIKSVNRQGACRETTWPYKIGEFAKKPSAPAYKEAAQHHVVELPARDADRESDAGAASRRGSRSSSDSRSTTSFMSAAVAKTGKLSMPQRRGEGRGRPRGAGRRLRRHASTASSCATRGGRLGHEGLLHDALRLPARRRPVGRLLDDSHRRLTGSAPAAQRGDDVT